MEKITVIIATSIFLITTFLGWKILGDSKKLNSNMYTRLKSKWIFWQSVVYSSAGATFVIMYILKWTDILTF